ncbi:MAG: hypothetical protein JXP48_12375 [Acidobacteria bacterium]|nr:hypothetical protein [Acidobacteriota bacterium]
MKRTNLVTMCIALSAAMLFPVLGQAQFAKAKPKPGDPPPGVQASQVPMVSCQRGGLQHAVRLYLAAQAKGDLSILPLANGLGYQENMKPADIKTGFLTKPLVIDKSMSLYDDASCQTFTEVIVTDKANPHVFGVRLRVNHDKIAEIELITTTTGDWLFNADNYLKYSSDENWGPIPADRRNTRAELVRGATAYLDAFLEAKTDLVPWGYPCVRVEGGMTTSQGTDADTCEAGLPAGVNIVNRRFVVDEVLGSVVVWCTFGAGGPGGTMGAPDTHLFRMENGKLRYVHTLTHLKMSDFRGPTGTNADNPAPKR